MDYYLVKSAAVQQDVLNVLAAPWATAFERSLHWIAGWRPTTAFQLIHTRSTMFIESRVYNMLNGGLAFTGDLGDLSADRFTALSRLQCRTVQEENALSDQLSAWQACKWIDGFLLVPISLIMIVPRAQKTFIDTLEKPFFLLFIFTYYYSFVSKYMHHVRISEIH